jgi:Na+/proline symporter
MIIEQFQLEADTMKTGSLLAIIVFIIIALAHLYRLINGLEVTIDAWVVPQWLSAGGVVLCVVLAGLLWKENR